MSAAASGAGETALATVAAWLLARRAAAQRGTSIGDFPCGLPAGAAIVAALAAWRVPLAFGAVAVIAIVSVAAVTDVRSGAIFDALTLALGVTTLITALANGTAPAALTGALAGGGSLLALYLVTQRRGIGLGDVKLGAGIGAGLGAGLGLIALGGAFVAGGAYGAWLLATRRARRDSAIRFGPFVAAGTYVAMLIAPGGR